MSRTSDPAINTPMHDRPVMESKAAQIKELIDENEFERAGYMPVTRDLSRGRRKLHRRWCDLVRSGAAPANHMLVAKDFEAKSERIVSLDSPEIQITEVGE